MRPFQSIPTVRLAALLRALRSTPLALEDEAADGGVDGGEVTVEELLCVVPLGGDVGALAKLEDRLERGRRVSTGARDDEALVLGLVLPPGLR